ncbi:MAG: hypothetical protein U1E37_05015 [Sphingomonadaceae bacterium]
MTGSAFDPDALLAALPRRSIRQFGPDVMVRFSKRSEPTGSALLLKGSYNGFSDRERYRTADLSNWLVKMGCTKRAAVCSICGSPAEDEHAEDYYDLTTWIGLCRRCHRTILHGRFVRPERWLSLLDEQGLPDGHWARLVASEPFDLAALLRSRGVREPIKIDFANSLIGSRS